MMEAFERANKYHQTLKHGKPQSAGLFSNLPAGLPKGAQIASERDRKFNLGDSLVMRLAATKLHDGQYSEAAWLQIYDGEGLPIAMAAYTNQWASFTSGETKAEMLRKLLAVAIVKEKFFEISFVEFTHNHPNGTKFSNGDVESAKQMKLLLEEAGIFVDVQYRLLRGSGDGVKVEGFLIPAQLKYRHGDYDFKLYDGLTESQLASAGNAELAKSFIEAARMKRENDLQDSFIFVDNSKSEAEAVKMMDGLGLRSSSSRWFSL